jgi:hypothetical protein
VCPRPYRHLCQTTAKLRGNFVLLVSYCQCATEFVSVVSNVGVVLSVMKFKIISSSLSNECVCVCVCVCVYVCVRVCVCMCGCVCVVIFAKRLCVFSVVVLNASSVLLSFNLGWCHHLCQTTAKIRSIFVL